jgi:hypothetical protein
MIKIANDIVSKNLLDLQTLLLPLIAPVVVIVEIASVNFSTSNKMMRHCIITLVYVFR